MWKPGGELKVAQSGSSQVGHRKSGADIFNTPGHLALLEA